MKSGKYKNKFKHKKFKNEHQDSTERTGRNTAIENVWERFIIVGKTGILTSRKHLDLRYYKHCSRFAEKLQNPKTEEKKSL